MVSEGLLPVLNGDANAPKLLQKRYKRWNRPTPETPFNFPPDANVFLYDPTVRERIRNTIYEVHDGLCFWTRSPLTKSDFAIDHVVPWSHNGPDNLFNLVPTSNHLNKVRKNAFETEAVTACLAIIRITYGPRSLRLLRQKMQAAGEPDGHWWHVEDEWIRRPRLIPYNGKNSLVEKLEDARTNIASLVRARDGGRWVFTIERWLTQRRIYRGSLADIRQAWCHVATAARSE